MHGNSSEEYWNRNWKASNQPAVFDIAMRDLAKAVVAGCKSRITNLGQEEK